MGAGAHFDRASQCIGKHRFANGALAWRVGRRRTDRTIRPIITEPYRCFWCGGWHLGTPLRRKDIDDE